MNPDPGAAESGRFLVNVNVILFTQAVNYGLAFLLNIIIARGLGPEGRGDYALFVLSTTLAASVCTLGTGLGTMYYLGKRKHDVPVLLGNMQFLVLLATATAALAVPAVGLALRPTAFADTKTVWLYILAFPLVLEFLLVTTVLIGNERFLGTSLSMLFQTLVLVVGAAVLYLGDWLTIFSILALWSASFAVAIAIALAAVGLENLSARRVVRPDLAVLREQVGMGLPGQLGSVLQFMNYRLDQFVIRFLRTRAEVGFYAVAVGLSESVWWIANAISMALLPRLTRMESQRAGEVTPLACRNTLLVSLVAGAGIAAAAPVAIDILFGDEFGPSVRPIAWLMPGIVALSGTKVLNSYMFSQGKVIINSYVALAAVVATILFDLLLIPLFGISGAAAASSIAYTLSFALSLHFYQRLSGNSMWECLIPRMSDARLYGGLARRIWSSALLAASTVGKARPQHTQ